MPEKGNTPDEFRASLEKVVERINLLTIGIDPDHLPLNQVSTYDPSRVTSADNLRGAIQAIEKIETIEEDGLHVIVTNKPKEIDSLLKTGIPLIYLSEQFDLEVISGLYRDGFFDCVWEKEDLPLSVYYAYLAGKRAYESAGKLTIYDIRQQQPFVLLANKDKRFRWSPKPDHDEIKEGCRDYGFVVKDVGIESVIPLIEAFSPKRVLINSNLFGDEGEKHLREIISASERNPDSYVRLIVDGPPSPSLINVAADNLVECYTRPSNVEMLVRLYLMKAKGIPHEQLAWEIPEPLDALIAGRAYHGDIERRFEAGLFGETRTQQLISYVSAAYQRFLELVHNQIRTAKKPIIRCLDDASREGILEALNPDRTYGPNEQAKIWKRTFDLAAWQLYFDSKKAQGMGTDFQQPKISIPIPLTAGNSFLVEEAIIGPNVRDMFFRLYKSEEGKQIQGAEKDLFRRMIYDIELEKLLFFQEQFSELSPIPGQAIDLAALRDPAYVIKGYIDNVVQAFENRSKYTDVNFNEDDIRNISAILKDYKFTFITRDTIRRNMAATFRNSILRTNLKNIDLAEFFNDLSSKNDPDNATTRLKAMLFRVDQEPKHSFALEDAWEMLDFYEAQLPEAQRTKRITGFIDNYPPSIRGQLREGTLPIRLYRDFRESDLFLSLYGVKEHLKLAQGIIEDPAYQSTKRLYKATMRMHDKVAIRTCELLPPNHPLRALLPYLKKAAAFTKVDYSMVK